MNQGTAGPGDPQRAGPVPCRCRLHRECRTAQRATSSRSLCSRACTGRRRFPARRPAAPRNPSSCSVPTTGP